MHETVVLNGGEIFSLLLQKGAIGSASQFQWVDEETEEAVQEVDNFWQEEEQAFVQSMQLYMEKD
jgi:hypothetical protein